MCKPAPVSVTSEGLDSYLAPTAHKLTEEAGADGGAESGLYVDGKLLSDDDMVSTSELGRDPNCVDRPGREAAGVTGADVEEVDTDSLALDVSGEAADSVASVPAGDGVPGGAFRVMSLMDSGNGTFPWSSECPCTATSEPIMPS